MIDFDQMCYEWSMRNVFFFDDDVTRTKKASPADSVAAAAFGDSCIRSGTRDIHQGPLCPDRLD